jgi:pimeloyl-ACP methyl ester carboxylesterase
MAETRADAAAVSPDDARTSVTLVHGLWMNVLAMVPLQSQVRKCGFNVNRFGYPSMHAGLDENAARLSRFITALDADVVHLVAHSLGGVVTLRALQLHPDPRVQRIVLLGSPVTGSLTGRRLATFRAGKLLLGKSERIWEAQPVNASPDGVAVGIIAGRMPIGLGRLIGTIREPNDGVVTVAETHVTNAADEIVMPVNHTGLVLSSKVARQVCAFLRDGRFVHVD